MTRDNGFFVVFEICDKNDIEAKIYPTWECKEVNFDFSLRKGHVTFYFNWKLSYLFHSTLSQLDRRRMFFVLFTKKDNQWILTASKWRYSKKVILIQIFPKVHKFVLSTKLIWNILTIPFRTKFKICTEIHINYMF